ncbi:MAG: hypothetical protein WAM05_01785 [Candidatus Binataceae bacterium]
MRRALAGAAFLAVLAIFSQAGFADESACDVSKAKADDLVALAALASFTDSNTDSNSPGVKCTVEGLRPASYYCDEKTRIVRDEMLGQGRRLIVKRTYIRKSFAGDQVFVFGCAFGRVVPMLAADNGGEAKIEHADPNKVIVVGPPTPPATTPDTETFDWDPKMQSYAPPEGGLPPLAHTLPCTELKTAKANDLIILANHEFNGSSGNFPFTHGTGCYGFDLPKLHTSCDWKVTLDQDRMISANRREILFESDHMTGTGAWGYSYVFGCVAGQVRLLFGAESLRGGLMSACDERAPSESGQPDSKELSVQSPQQPSPSPVPSYNCASWEDSKSDQLTYIGAAWGPGQSSCSACEAPDEEVMTFKWSPELRNYLLDSVHYRPSSN